MCSIMYRRIVIVTIMTVAYFVVAECLCLCFEHEMRASTTGLVGIGCRGGEWLQQIHTVRQDQVTVLKIHVPL